MNLKDKLEIAGNLLTAEFCSICIAIEENTLGNLPSFEREKIDNEKLIQEKREAYERISKIYSRNGNFIKAAEYQNKSDHLSPFLRN